MMRLVLFMVLLCIGVSSQWAQSVSQSVILTYELESGWNLISLFPDSATTAGDLLLPLMKADSCAYSLEETYVHFCSGSATGPTSGSTATGFSLQSFQGIFLESDGGTFSVTASVPLSPSIDLKSGWNLTSLGFSGDLSGATSLPANLGSVISYGQSHPGTYAARVIWPGLKSQHSLIAQTLTTVDFLQSYFVRSQSNQTLNVTYPDSIAAQLDLTLPSLIALTPSTQAQTIETDSSFHMQFSERLAASSISTSSIRLLQDSQPVNATLTTTDSGQGVLLTLSSPLSYNSTYQLQITSLTDPKGNLLLNPQTATFTTTNAPPAPDVITISPSDGSTNIEPGSSVQIGFNVDLNSSSVTSETIKLLQNGSAVSASLAVSGAAVTLTPETSLMYGLAYTVAVSSVVSTQRQTMETVRTYSFGVRSRHNLSVLATEPSSQATQIATDSTIRLDFSTAVAPASVTSDSLKLLVSGSKFGYTTAFEMNNTRIRITPSEALPFSTAVMVVASGIQSWEGATLNPAHEFEFSTQANPNEGVTLIQRSLCDTASLAGEPPLTTVKAMVTTTANTTGYDMHFSRYEGASNYGMEYRIFNSGGTEISFDDQIIDTATLGTMVWLYDAGVGGFSSLGNNFRSSHVNDDYRWIVTPRVYSVSAGADSTRTLLATGSTFEFYVSQPPPPENLSATVKSGGVDVAWCPAPGATQYILEAGSSPYQASSTATVQATSASLNNLNNQETYYVWVRSSLGDTRFSAPSNLLRITPAANPQYNLSVSEVSLNQGSEIMLYPTTNTSTPMIAGKTGVLRVLADVEGASDHLLHTMSLELSYPDTNAKIRIEQEAISQPMASKEASAGNQLRFDVAGEYFKPQTRIQIQLDSKNALAETSEGDNTWPPSEPYTLSMSSPEPMIVRLVPLTVNGVTMPQEAEFASELQGYLASMYPMNTVSVGWYSLAFANQTLRVGNTTAQSCDGVTAYAEFCDWQSLLAEFHSAADTERNGAKLPVYYGVFRPEAQDSGSTQLAGLAYTNNLGVSNSQMSGVGLGYKLKEFVETAAHEIGHNFGRRHVAHTAESEGARCSDPGNTDDNYPHDNGLIGSTGFLHKQGKLFDPTYYWDVMSYCNRVWVSDYNYKAFHDFWAELNGLSAQGRLRLALNQTSMVEGYRMVLNRSDDGVWELSRVAPTRGYVQEIQTDRMRLQARLTDGSYVLVPAHPVRLDHIDVHRVTAFVPADMVPTEVVLRDPSDQEVFRLTKPAVSRSVSRVGSSDLIEDEGHGWIRVAPQNRGQRMLRRKLSDGSYRLLLNDNDESVARLKVPRPSEVELILGTGLFLERIKMNLQ